MKHLIDILESVTISSRRRTPELGLLYAEAVTSPGKDEVVSPWCQTLVNIGSDFGW